MNRDHRVAIFTVVSLALLMSSLDQTIVATALHSLQHGLGASLTWTGWTITIYSLALMVMLPVSGALSDRYGRRRVFLSSVIVFTAGSLCCGLAGNIYLLVGFRALQAIGGAGFTPSATGIVVEHFGSARDKAVGLFGSIFPIGATLGPILGGVIVAYWSWRGIFLVNVPVGVALVPLGLHFIPADRPRDPGRGRRPDPVGMVLLGGGVLAAMLGLTYLGDAADRANAASFAVPLAVCAVVSVLLLWLFARHIGHSEHPFIAPRLIRGHGFGAVNVINIVYGGGVSGLVTLVPLYATTRYGIGALNSGTVLAAQGVAVIVLSATAATLLRRTGYRGPLYLGSVIAAAGMAALAVLPGDTPPYLWLAAMGCVIGIGLGWSGPASRNACLQLAPEHSASLAALRTMGRQVGSIVSISVATAVISSSADPGGAQAVVYAVAAAGLLAALPVISRVPEHRGSW